LINAPTPAIRGKELKWVRPDPFTGWAFFKYLVMKTKKITETIIRKQLAAAIRERRIQKGITTIALADQINLQRTRIPALEQGRVKNIDTYIRAMQVLDGQLKIEWN